MNWANFSVVSGLVALGFYAAPWGLLLVAFVAWTFWREWRSRK